MTQGSPKKSKQDEVTIEDVRAKVHEFFGREHDDGGKRVAAQDLMTMRTECIAVGMHSRTRLIEMKKLQSFVQRELPGSEDYLALNREPTISDPPELGLGMFALKVMKKSEVARLKVRRCGARAYTHALLARWPPCARRVARAHPPTLLPPRALTGGGPRQERGGHPLAAQLPFHRDAVPPLPGRA
jgi:hypothetical protein